MKNVAKNSTLLLITIFILAFFLRIFKLNDFPLGFHVDEAKVAWEAFSILKTGRDDHGNLLALYYNSFGDYRPTGIFYSAIPFILLFGKNIFAVRFSAAFIGALTVFPIYFITLQITKSKKTALITSVILTIIPWHLVTSRATSEVVISCFLILVSLAILSKKPIFSFILLSSSFFFYHSARVMGPLFMIVWIGYLFQSKIKLPAKKIVIGFLLSSFLSAILLFSPTGLARYDQVKLTSPSLRGILVNYSSYFDPNFLIGDIAKPFRYATANVGIVSIPIFIYFLIGIFFIIKKNKDKILLLFIVLGPIPAALTLEDSPNLHRAFFMLPFLVIISAVGLNWLWENHRIFSNILIFCLIWSFISFTISYFNTTNNFAYEYRNPQTKEVALYLSKVHNNYTKIYVTNDPDSPYPWYAFFDNIDPLKINSQLEKQVNGKWQFGNIVWDNNRCPAGNAFDEAKKDKSLIKVMVIDNGVCFTDFGRNHPEAKIIKEFSYPEGTSKVKYRVWEYEPTRT